MNQERMDKKGGNRKAMLVALAAVCIVITALLALYLRFRPQTAAGTKEIVLDVVYQDLSVDSYQIRTDGLYLEQALEDAEGLTVEGSRTQQFGLMITSVNGVEADYQKNQAYWSVELDGVPCNYGVSQQPIRDGQHYRLVYVAADGS